jgi:hypothetical protein
MRAPTYAGLFLLTLAALMHEILLTRIFSVTLWYHFAFVAISVAMFGMTVGAVWVYLNPDRYPVERAPRQLGIYALGYALTAVASFAVYLRIPLLDQEGVVRASALGLCYLVIAIPFGFSGVAVTLALTRFPKHVGRLYGADLLGAALGCILVIAALDLTDAPSGILAVGAVAGFASWLFALGTPVRALRVGSLAVALLLAVGVFVHTARVRDGRPLLGIVYARGAVEKPHLYERWNSYSRVHVEGNPRKWVEPSGWGLSPRAPREPRVRQLYMGIDITAGTLIAEYRGDTTPLEYLKYDVTNVAHHIRPESDVLVVGVGGGRDVLSALVFDQASVLGVEVNENVLRATNGRFGRFSGHLDRDPRVSFVVDEARSLVARSQDEFDIIQISLIDTWAATAAGAFVLSENALYTVEAWSTFVAHLSSRGLLSVSRWAFQKPGEIYRLVSLAAATLKRLGVENPRDHVVIVKLPRARGLAGDLGNGVATLLLGRNPLSPSDLATLRRVASDMEFEVVLAPDDSQDEIFEAILSGEGLDAFAESLAIDLSAPTDDRPFFFQMLRLRDVFRTDVLNRYDLNAFNLKAVRVLVLLLLTVVALTGVFILLPLALRTRRGALKGNGSLLVFFAAIGLGFMFIEISQMQRLMIFLGHPTYALSIVLFTLLLASGCGSLLTDRLAARGVGIGELVQVVLVLVLAVFGLLTPIVTQRFEAAPGALRIAVGAGLLVPMGFLMGMPFPIGMKLASARAAALTPWLWGLNGAASVCCSVLAVVVALAAGISTSFWIGVLCYAVALVAFGRASRGARGAPRAAIP